MIYVMTSILNGFDNLRPPAAPAEEFARYVCFTNIPNLPRVHPWEYRPAYLSSEHPGRSSRIPKILPHLMLPPDAEYSIWHDGNFRLRMGPIEIIETLLRHRDWAAYAHPCRSCIYDEAKILLEDKGMEGWRAQRPDRAASVRDEIARYQSGGFPGQAGLWANGFIVRRHTVGVRDMNEAWWRLYSQGSERDQLSFPVARCERDFPIATIPGSIYSSPYLQFCWHAAFLHKEDNPDFWDERARTRARLAQIAELAGPAAGVDFESY